MEKRRLGPILLPTHIECARYAAEAYLSEGSARLGHGLEFTHTYLPDTGVHVIAIQGSDFDPRDWLRNLFSWGYKDPELGRTVFGFGQASLRMADYVCNMVQPSEPIVLTGHSAGAAIAVYTAQRLYKRSWYPVECVGFASPRTGRRRLHVPTTLYDHAGDIVCKLPWWWKHPVTPIVLPDQSALPFQHDMDYYIEAMEPRILRAV